MINSQKMFNSLECGLSISHHLFAGILWYDTVIVPWPFNNMDEICIAPFVDIDHESTNKMDAANKKHEQINTKKKDEVGKTSLNNNLCSSDPM